MDSAISGIFVQYVQRAVEGIRTRPTAATGIAETLQARGFRIKALSSNSLPLHPDAFNW